MAVKESYTDEQPQQNPWVQTPLRESYALSEAAGWYGHTSPTTPTPLSPFAFSIRTALGKEISKS